MDKNGLIQLKWPMNRDTGFGNVRCKKITLET